jgi:hypothetical protein
MPFHIEHVTSEVTVLNGDLPLTEAQVEKLIRLIMKRLADRDRDAALSHDASSIKRQVSPALRFGD